MYWTFNETNGDALELEIKDLDIKAKVKIRGIAARDFDYEDRQNEAILLKLGAEALRELADDLERFSIEKSA